VSLILVLPLPLPATYSPLIHKAPQTRYSRTMHILLVEDDPALRHLVSTVLTHEGHQVSKAEDGEEGVRLARTLRPDAVLLDGIMPKLDGIDVLRALREDPATRALPVVFLSAMDDERTQEEVRSLGVRHLLSKPVEVATLKQVLRDIEQSAGSGD
jgi:CheY-like chemotaxis protein